MRENREQYSRALISEEANSGLTARLFWIWRGNWTAPSWSFNARSRSKNKYRSLLRELLDAKHSSKSEQLSEEQLALFEAAWKAEQLGATLRQKHDRIADAPFLLESLI